MGEETNLTRGATRVGAPGRQPRREKTRAKAFGPTKHAAFLAALAQSANVRHACRTAGVSIPTVYRTRASDAGFAQGWRQALADGLLDLEIELLERARKGSKTTVTRSDGSREVRHAHSDKLAMQLLNRHRPRPADARAEGSAGGRSAEEICAEIERRIAAMNETTAA